MTHTSACVIHICVYCLCVLAVQNKFFMFDQLAQRPTILCLGVACGQPPRQHRLAFVTVTQLRHTFTHTKQGQKVQFQTNCSQARIYVGKRFEYLSVRWLTRLEFAVKQDVRYQPMNAAFSSNTQKGQLAVQKLPLNVHRQVSQHKFKTAMNTLHSNKSKIT